MKPMNPAPNTHSELDNLQNTNTLKYMTLLTEKTKIKVGAG